MNANAGGGAGGGGGGGGAGGAGGGGKNGGGGSNGASFLSKPWTVFFALVILAGFAVAFVWLTKRVTTPKQTEWDRLIYLYGALEAMAFAVVGAIFGTTVQRQATDQANKRADDHAKDAQGQRQRADQHQQDAANGQALAKLIKGEAKAPAMSEQIAVWMPGRR